MSIELKEPILAEQVDQVKADLKGKVYNFGQKILPLYRILNWEWSQNDGITFKVPNAVNIMECLYSLIDNLDTIYDVSSSGGLEVGYERNEEGNITEGYIRFVLEDSKYY